MSKKKILFIHHHKHFGGATRSLYDLINAAKKKFNVHLLTPDGEVVSFFRKLNLKLIIVSGLPIIDISFSGRYKGVRWVLLIREIYYFIKFYFEFLLFVDKNKYDVIHINEFLVIPILPFIKKKYKSSKIVIHLRTIITEDNNFLKRICFNIVEKNVHTIIAIDENVKNCLPSKLKRKTVVMYNPQKFSKNLIKKKRSKILRIGFVGPINKDKGIEKLISVAKKINEKQRRVLFILFGNLEKNFLSTLLHYLNIKKNYYFYFKKNNFFKKENIKVKRFTKNINKIYKLFDVNISIQDPGSYGRSMIESASYNIPSLISLKKNFNEAIIHKKTGFFVKHDDEKSLIEGINFFLKNKKIINKLGRNNYLFFKKRHSTEIFTKNILNLFSKI